MNDEIVWVKGLVRHCFDEHVKDIGGSAYFSFEEYNHFWINHAVGSVYHLVHKDKSVDVCKVAYYPLPYYKDLRALIEIDKNGSIDFREVPIKFLERQ